MSDQAGNKNVGFLMTRLICFAGAKSAFTVTNPDMGLQLYHLRFTRVITNIGGRYSTSTGIFTSEYPGIYEFALHILKDSGANNAHCAIRKNESSVAIARSDPWGAVNTGYTSGSTSVVLHLSRGDLVDVYCDHTVGNLLAGYSDMYNSFSGVLLQAE